MFDPNSLGDNPIIKNMMATGFPDGVEPEIAKCPVCGDECDFFYINEDNEVVGCENCLCLYGAKEWLDDEEYYDDEER